MLELANLSAADRNYLKQKWSAQTEDMDLEISRANKRLSDRLERQSLSEAEITDLEGRLAHAEAVASQLEASGAAAELISAQEAVVSGISLELSTRSDSGLTDREAYLQQAAIAQLVLRKQYLQSQITAIDALGT